MSRGPLPSGRARRRNAPTIATTTLPAAGRTGRAPRVPAAYELREAGAAWWKWAWRLPQATKWDRGALYAVARRAQLEDDLAALELADDVDLLELLQLDDDDRARTDAARNLEFALRKLKASASGRVGVMKEMRELDNRLGLNPKAMADLRWTIAEAEDERPQLAAVASLASFSDRLG